MTLMDRLQIAESTCMLAFVLISPLLGEEEAPKWLKKYVQRALIGLFAGVTLCFILEAILEAYA